MRADTVAFGLPLNEEATLLCVFGFGVQPNQENGQSYQAQLPRRRAHCVLAGETLPVRPRRQV